MVKGVEEILKLKTMVEEAKIPYNLVEPKENFKILFVYYDSDKKKTMDNVIITPGSVGYPDLLEVAVYKEGGGYLTAEEIFDAWHEEFIGYRLLNGTLEESY